MRSVKVIFKYIYYTFIALIVLLALNNTVVRSDKLFDIVGVRLYTVLTGSMEPEIKPGDVVLVKSVNADKLNVDDVITFKYDDFTVTHRIVEEDDGGFITKGDNNNVEDREVVNSNDIIGKVIVKIPKLGHLMVFLSKPIVIVISLILLALYILKETFFEEDENKESKESV